MESNSTVYVWIFKGNNEETSCDKAYRIYLKTMFLENPAPYLVVKKEETIINKK